MFVSDRYNVLTFQKLLGGCKDLSLKIIDEKQQLELKERKQEMIERDFYNWLNYDLPVRSYLGILIVEYRSLPENKKIEFLVNNIENKSYGGEYLQDYFRYYDNLKSILGLNEYYERTKQTHLLFQTDSKWWKTTQKNSIPWENIHKIIRCNVNVKVYKWSWRYFHTQEMVEGMYLENPEFFREATLKEKYYVYSSCLRRNNQRYLFIDCNNHNLF